MIIFLDKFINGNQLILNEVNNKNDYPIVLKKILSERIDLQKCGFNLSKNERDFCIWLMKHGVNEYPYLFEGNFKNNIILDWFSKRNKENIPRIIQSIWDINYKLQRIRFLKNFKIFSSYFLFFRWNKFLTNPNLSYDSFFDRDILGLENLIRFLNLFKFKKIKASKITAKKIKVNLLGHLNYQSGIGEDVRKTYLALKHKGIKTEIIDFGIKKRQRKTKEKLKIIQGNNQKFDLDILIICLNPNDCLIELFINPEWESYFKSIPKIKLIYLMDWETFLLDTQNRNIDIVLNPIFHSEFNSFRSPTKFFDTTRLGAVGIYSQTIPYSSFVKDNYDGILLKNDLDLWCQNIIELLENPNKREYLYQNAMKKLV